MRVTGWYQRYRNHYARFRAAGMTHEEANQEAIRLVKEEGK